MCTRNRAGSRESAVGDFTAQHTLISQLIFFSHFFIIAFLRYCIAKYSHISSYTCTEERLSTYLSMSDFTADRASCCYEDQCFTVSEYEFHVELLFGFAFISVSGFPHLSHLHRLQYLIVFAPLSSQTFHARIIKLCCKRRLNQNDGKCT